MKRYAALGAACVAAPASLLYADTGSAWSPWAVQVVSYQQGTGANPSLVDPGVALGSPERFTGESTPYPSVVSPFNPAFGLDEIVSIGEGGHLTVRFDTPITNDPANPFGVDFSIFGNGSFLDIAYPAGQLGTPPGTFGLDPMIVEVSADGSSFTSLGSFTEGLFPGMGYLDSAPFDTTPGAVHTDFTTPIDPSLTLNDFSGLAYNDIRALYNGSGGGTPIDIAASGLSSIQYVRIVNPVASGVTVEIDAFARVPAPATPIMLAGIAACVRRRR